MRCDYCGVLITFGNNGGHAPHGIPLYVCKHCYQILLKSEAKQVLDLRDEAERFIEEVQCGSGIQGSAPQEP